MVLFDSFVCEVCLYLIKTLTDHSESLEPLQDGSVAGATTQIS